VIALIAVLAVLAAASLFAACGGGGGPSDLTLASSPTTTGGPTTTSTTVASPSTLVPAAGQLPSALALVARPRGAQLDVYDEPNAAQPSQRLPNPWAAVQGQPSVRVSQVFLVESQRSDGWLQILLPVSPNGTDAWVRTRDVTVSSVPYRVRVRLRARQATVLDRGRVLWTGPAAVGASSTPTPTGEFYVRAVINAPAGAHTVYGPAALGLASRLHQIAAFSGADSEIGLHGTADEAALGKAVTLGSVRIANAEIRRLAATLPLGTPVDILG